MSATRTNPETGRRERRCEDCGQWKQLTRRNFHLRPGTDPAEWRNWRYVCKPCLRERHFARPRACLRCHEVKPGDAFDLGPTGKRRRGVCRECVATTGHRLRRVAPNGPRKVSTWHDGGRPVRRCYVCEVVYPLDGEHFYANTTLRGEHERFNYRCIECSKAVARKQHQAVREDPERLERKRAQQRAAQRRYRERDPERVRAIQRKSSRRVMQDPERRRRRLESQRMAAALRRERRTGKMRQRAIPVGLRYTVETERVGVLPAAPLAAAISRYIGRLGPVLVGDEQSGGAVMACERLGVSDRSYRDWRSGARKVVQVDVVDRVLLAAGWNWWDVYGDEPPEVQAKAAALLGGEAVAV